MTDISLNIFPVTVSHAVTLEDIGLLGNTKLYCSSMDAIETVASPTFFCKFQGWSMFHSLKECVLVYPLTDNRSNNSFFDPTFLSGPAMTGALIFMVFGWLFHISLVFFKIAFPILSLKIQRYFKWIHVCLLCVGKSIAIVTCPGTYMHMYSFEKHMQLTGIVTK